MSKKVTKSAKAKTTSSKVTDKDKAKGYLHGYSTDEQDRLYEQARFLEPMVYDKIDFSGVTKLIEVGCGVGAQTEILLERFPHLHIQGVDAAPEQIKRAKQRLAKPIKEKRVELVVADALKLPYADNSFEAAFVCFFLEHVASPVDILREVRRVLKPGGLIYCTEVLNATFFLHPYSPATLRYWFAFNDHQWNLGGDPFVGAKLGNYLMASGFQNITTDVKSFHYDNRAPKLRAQMIEYWAKLLLSGTAGLLAANRTTQEEIIEMTAELKRLTEDPNSVFFYSPVQASGQAF